MPVTWNTRAACRGLDPEIFFPGEGEEPARAIAVCQCCEVKDPCLEFALGNRERAGVWGGSTERDRRRIMRQRRQKAS